MAKPRPREGDVFTVSAGDGRVIVGQVVAKYGRDAFYVAVFADPLPEECVPSGYGAVVRGELMLLALTLDAKFYVGHWTIVANTPVHDGIPLPAYKEGVAASGLFDVVDYTGRRRRRATADEATELPYRTIVAPVRVEKAARAVLGLEPWVAAYSDLQPRNTTTQNLFG